MEDPNLIACLFPVDGHRGKKAREAVFMTENSSRRIPPQAEPVSEGRGQDSTFLLEDEEGSVPDGSSSARLELTFNPGPKAKRGFVLGTGPDCDIVLPQLLNICPSHCALAFDAQRRLILRDFSTHGTTVTYDDRGKKKREDFTWILSGHQVPEDTERIVIDIQGVTFQIVVSRHDDFPDSYLEKVDQFSMNAREIQSLKVRKPGNHRICIERDTLGTGGFAIVKRFWDVSSGSEYAYKKPHDKKDTHKKVWKMWKKEADILGQISHDHIVKLVDTDFLPWPRLILEYIPFGTLQGQTKIPHEDCMTILCQALSALVYLHGHNEPVVHRDIKPGNILVHSRQPLHIKLADFGFSKKSNDLKTFCGTGLYLAPEVYAPEVSAPEVHKTPTYTPVVDVWSLGVVVFELAYGLPDDRDYNGKNWCAKIIEEATTRGSEDLAKFLSAAMLVIEPNSRHSAQDCYEVASRLHVKFQ